MLKKAIRFPAALLVLGLVLGIGAFVGPGVGVASAATPCDGTNWLTYGGGTWSCDGAGGVYGSTTSGDSMLLSNGGYGDFVLGATITNLTTNAGFGFHMADMDNGYLLRFIPQGVNQFAGIWLSKRVGGVETSLGFFPTTLSIGQPATFVIVGSGNTYAITLNGVALGSFVDGSFPTGAAGFVISSSNGAYGDTATFANAYVNPGTTTIVPLFSPNTYACPDGYNWSAANGCFQVQNQRFFCPDGRMYDNQGNYWNNDGSWAGMQNDFHGCFDPNVFFNHNNDNHGHDMNDPHNGNGGNNGQNCDSNSYWDSGSNSCHHNGDPTGNGGNGGNSGQNCDSNSYWDSGSNSCHHNGDPTGNGGNGGNSGQNCDSNSYWDSGSNSCHHNGDPTGNSSCPFGYSSSYGPCFGDHQGNDGHNCDSNSYWDQNSNSCHPWMGNGNGGNGNGGDDNNHCDQNGNNSDVTTATDGTMTLNCHNNS